MELYFLRHGIAQDHAPNLHDADRELVPAGRAKIQQLAQKLSLWEVAPGMIYSSPRVRARQTAEIVADYGGFPMQISPLLDFEFNAAALQTLVDQHGPGDSLLLVGHEPSFSETISYIIGGGNITLKKGGLAKVELFSQHPLHGSLGWLLAPKVLGG
jgi:phosphohistidine phosphatase